MVVDAERVQPRAVAGPTPHRARTGRGWRKASSWSGRHHHDTRARAVGPPGAAAGLAAREASLASSLVRATPTAQSSCRSSRTASPDGVGASVGRRARGAGATPATSRKASSRAMPSTTGENRWSTAWSRSLISA